MKRIIAFLLISVLVAPPTSAGQGSKKVIAWQDVRKLPAGIEIAVTATGGQPTKARLLFADDAILVTLKPTAAKLPKRVEEFLFGIGPAWPAIVNDGSYKYHRLRVSQEGLFDGDKKLADLADLVQQTPRGDVVEISDLHHSHVVRYVFIGAAVVGFLLFSAFLAAISGT